MRFFRSLVRRALLVLALWTAALPAAGQRYLVHTYSENDGLPSSTIYDVLQDPTGRIWLATRAGIAVYDGTDWSTYTTSDGLPHASQAALALDEDGTLWSVPSLGDVVSYLEGGRWHTLPQRPSDHGLTGVVTGLAATRRGARTLVAASTADALAVWDGAAWSVPLSGAVVRGLAASGGRFYVATDLGLALYDGELTFPDVAGLSDRSAPALLGLGLETVPERPAAPRLWVLGEGWLGKLEGERFTLLAEGLALPPEYVNEPSLRLAGDGHGGLLYGNPSELYHFVPGGGTEVLRASSGLVARGTTALHRDREGNVWVGSLRGLSKIVSFRFATWQKKHGLLEEEVTAVVERRGGGYVLGHPSGLTFLEDGGVRTLRFSGAEAAKAGALRVLDLAEGPGDDLWIAASGLGLGRLDGRGEIRWYFANSPFRTASVVVRHDGAVRTAVDRGVFQLLGDRFVPVEGAPEEHLRRLYEGPGGALYVATGLSGLHVFSDGSWSRVIGSEREANNVFAVLEDPDGHLWVGTSGGLYERRGKSLVRAGVPEVRRTVYFLLRDRSRRLWIGTDNGVLRWDGETLEHFTVRHGLAGRETNRAAGLVDSAGHVWIGTDAGVSVYRGELDRRAGVAPRIELAGVEVGGALRRLDEPLLLGHRESDLTFRFQGISFLDEKRLLYRSWLEGYEAGWLAEYPSPTRSLRYTNLTPGTYRFHVQVESAGGVRSPVASSAAIEIAFPWWRRSWFYAAAALAAGAVFVLFQRVYSQWRYSRLLEVEVRRRTAELVDEKERLAVTLDSIADAVVTTAVDGTLLLANPAAEEVTGWRAVEAVGKKLREVLPLARCDGEDPVDAVAEVVAGRGFAGEALRTRHRDGTERLVEVSGAPLRHAGEIAGAVLAFRDTTERRRLENEALKAQQLEALGLLAGGIAHDFNNVLTGVLGNLELVTLGDPGGEVTARVKQAKTAVLRARDLTKQLTTFAQGGAPIRETAALGPLVADAVRYSFHDSKTHCKVDLAEDLWLVEVDAGQVQQALGNLLLHAGRRMPGGGVVRVRGQNLTLKPSVGSSLAPGRYVALEIRDQGPGIPAEHLATIFDPYSAGGREAGGLGLATAYSIVRRHGGRLRVHSEPGRGSTFHVELPASEATGRKSRRDDGEIALGRGRVLVMDDEEVVRIVTGKMLSRLGYTPECTREGRETIERYLAARDGGEAFDAVILDLTIRDGLGGRETIAELRRLDPEVNAIVCSGYSKDPVMSSYREHGFRGVLPKPFQLSDLGRVLREILAEDE